MIPILPGLVQKRPSSDAAVRPAAWLSMPMKCRRVELGRSETSVMMATRRGVHRLHHRRIVGRDDDGAVDLAGIEPVEPADQRRRIERVVLRGIERQPLVAGGAHAPAHRGDEALHEGVAAIGDEKGDAQIARPRQQRSREVAAEVEGLDGVLDLLGRFGPDAGAAVEHAVDRREGNAGRPCHVVHGRAFSFNSFLHWRPHRFSRRLAVS